MDLKNYLLDGRIYLFLFIYLFVKAREMIEKNTSSFLVTCNDPRDGEKEPIRVDPRFFDLPIFPGEKEFRYSEYYNCNGIICLAGFGEDMMLCNPVLREYLLVKSTGYSFSRLGMGFGYDSRTDDYKIVRISNVPRYRAEVTTVGTNTWREIEMPIDDPSVQRLCGYAY